jgi:hypothetical protein
MIEVRAAIVQCWQGARQISGTGSCGRFRLICSGFPEIIEASTEFRAAQGDDGVCAPYGPVHAGALPTATLQPASTTPLEVHNLCWWNFRYRIRRRLFQMYPTQSSATLHFLALRRSKDTRAGSFDNDKLAVVARLEGWQKIAEWKASITRK